jgi:hypothetical protein
MGPFFGAIKGLLPIMIALFARITTLFPGRFPLFPAIIPIFPAMTPLFPGMPMLFPAIIMLFPAMDGLFPAIIPPTGDETTLFPAMMPLFPANTEGLTAVTIGDAGDLEYTLGSFCAVKTGVVAVAAPRGVLPSKLNCNFCACVDGCVSV